MTRYRINHDNVVADTIDDEVLAIRSDTGTYYSMRGAAAEIWTAATSGAPLEALTAAIAANHPSADSTAVAADVAGFVETLVTDGLLVEQPDGDDSTMLGELTSSGDAAWATPELERFDDMQDLLLFDPIHEVQPSGWPNVTER